ncbi:MAG: hypothetical protein GC151_04230 [Betaproteobacteria bacterium]|nr:hypothetical protein [Betaproteobacteria bacterium]
MDRTRLDAFWRPASVAVVGAGERPSSSGGAVLRNLEVSGWSGRVVPVNPRGGVIRGVAAVTSLREVTPPVDLVTVVVRPEAILDIVREAAESGHRNVLILPGGFAEAGEAGRARDRQLRALAREHDILIGGPNCAGLINLLDARTPFAATFLRDMPRGGPVAFVSQSGALIEELIASSHAMHIPLGAVVSVGNAMHLDLAEHVAHLGDDPACRAIVLYVESFGDRDRFRAVARAVTRRKPVVALIGGRTDSGRSAALRHTGSAALSTEEADEFCRDCGLVRVTSLRELKLAAKVLGYFPAGFGRRALILSNSGGPGVLAADRAVAGGLQLVPLPPGVRDDLRATLPAEAAVDNPMDLLADAREDRFGAALRILVDAAQDLADCILMIHVVPFMVDAAPVVDVLARISASSPVPVMHCMMGTLEDRDTWFAQLESARVPVFDDAEDMCVAAAVAARYSATREAPS